MSTQARKVVLSVEQALAMPYATLRLVHLGAPQVNLSMPGIVRLSVSAGDSTALLPLGTTGSLVLLELTVNPDAAVGPSALNLRADVRDAWTQAVTSLADGALQDLVLVPAPTNAATDAVDGVLTVVERSGLEDLLADLAPDVTRQWQR